jgi:hypothetical protein
VKTCAVPGCTRPHSGLGYCNLHYQRFKKHGSTDKPQAVRAKAAHGTRSRYVAGCRCEKCRRAERMYARTRRLRAVWAPIFATYLASEAA